MPLSHKTYKIDSNKFGEVSLLFLPHNIIDIHNRGISSEPHRAQSFGARMHEQPAQEVVVPSSYPNYIPTSQLPECLRGKGWLVLIIH